MFECILNLIIMIVIFLILTCGLKFIANKIHNSSNQVFDLNQYFPEDELYTLKQVFYLVIMFLCFIFLIYNIMYSEHDIWLFAVLEIVLSVYLASKLEGRTIKNVILFFMLVPYGSLDFFLTGGSAILVLEYAHMAVLIYYIKVYYDKFREYTMNNGLGIAIILLFVLIFVSFITTMISEGVNPLDSINMVSNAFTSNGYAILGKTSFGKLNNLFLVWGGYILSGVGTATLTAAILTKHFNKKFDELEELIKKNNED